MKNICTLGRVLSTEAEGNLQNKYNFSAKINQFQYVFLVNLLMAMKFQG